MDKKILHYTIEPFNSEAAAESKKQWDSIAKPLGSLGLLEDYVIQIAGLVGTADCNINTRGVLVFCADNGVVKQGVTQTGSEVTGVVAKNIAMGEASVCLMAKIARAEVITVDMGMNENMNLPALINRRMGAGTGDISQGPAMTREQAIAGIEAGIELVRSAKRDGCRLLLTGEMGIGNTTTSSAMAAVLLNCNVDTVTGRGAGLSGTGLRKKIEVIYKAIEVNKPDKEDPLDILAKLGGFDIAGMVGAFIGGAVYRIPIVIDGFISSVAALVALRLFPDAKQAMLASHVSAEPAGAMLLSALGLKPIIHAEMRLGEGTGAVALVPLLDMAFAIYHGRTFDDIAIESYKPLH